MWTVTSDNVTRFTVDVMGLQLIVLLKSRNRIMCIKYTGISIMDALVKIYDMLFLNRLRLCTEK